MLNVGMTKDQISSLLGRPHFNEGFIGVREWNYLLKMALGQGAEKEIVTCQLNVRFNNEMRADAYHWLPSGCAELPTSLPTTAAVAPATKVLRSVTLAGDILFAFNGSSLTDLTEQGRQKLISLVGDLGKLKGVKRIEILAYTDRLGSDAYNLSLSEKRAHAIQSLFIRSGIDSNVVFARGMGKSNPPLTQCGAMPKDRLIQCTAPDRRVEIQVFGTN